MNKSTKRISIALLIMYVLPVLAIIFLLFTFLFGAIGSSNANDSGIGWAIFIGIFGLIFMIFPIGIETLFCVLTMIFCKKGKKIGARVCSIGSSISSLIIAASSSIYVYNLFTESERSSIDYIFIGTVIYLIVCFITSLILVIDVFRSDAQSEI